MCLLAAFALGGVVEKINFYNDVWFFNAELVRRDEGGIQSFFGGATDG